MEEKGLKKYRRILKEQGFKALLKAGGWRLVVGVIIYYLIRDSFLYILLPYLIAKNLSNEPITMMTGMLHMHSLLRYLLLIAIFVALYLSMKPRKGDRMPMSDGAMNWLNRSTVFAVVFAHIQLVLGLVLMFFGDKGSGWMTNMKAAMESDEARFFLTQHSVMMLIAIVLITIGRSKFRKRTEVYSKAKAVKVFFGLALIIILVSIPWPFMTVARDWLPF